MARKDKQEILAMTLALFTAFFLWVYMMGEKNPDITKVIRDIPVSLVNQENIEQANLAIMPRQEFFVDLTITGKTLDVVRATAEDFKIEADMGGYLKKGENNIIPVDIKSTPKGVSVVNRAGYPYTIRVSLDSLLIKSVPVVVSVKGTPKEGFGSLDPVARPSEILISGPSSYVSQVTAAVGQVDIAGIADDIKESIPLRAQDKDGKIIEDIEIEPKNIDVLVSIKPSKEVPILVKTTGSLPEGRILKSLKSKTEKIIIIGDTEELDKINSIDTAPIDLRTITKSQTKDIALNIPANVVLKGNIINVSVDISVENRVDKTFNIVVLPVDEAQEYNYTYSANTIDVIVTGSEELLNSLDPKNITAQITLKGLVEGSHNIPVKITHAEGITVSEYTPQSITVTITKK